MEQLFSGRMPKYEQLQSGGLLKWWRVERSNGGIYLIGIAGMFHPREVSTGKLCWMDAQFRWCRCDNGWWRLGEHEVEIPMDLEDFG